MSRRGSALQMPTMRPGGAAKAAENRTFVFALTMVLFSSTAVVAFVTSPNRMFLQQPSLKTFRPPSKSSSSSKRPSSSLSMYLSEDGPTPPSHRPGRNNNNNNGKGEETSLRRLDVRGVSVSPAGFLLLLSAQTQTRTVAVPVRVTPPSAGDEYAATSAEALTIIQLLSGVDMAGAVLPPQTLQDLVASYCTYDDADEDEEDEEDSGIIEIEDELGLASFGVDAEADAEAAEAERQQQHDDALSVVRAVVSESLPDDVPYEEASQWHKVRVKHPRMTLDGVRIGMAHSTSSRESEREGVSEFSNDLRPASLVYTLQVTIEKSFRLELPLYSEVVGAPHHPEAVRRSLAALQSVASSSAFAYHPGTNAAFVAVALALRYRVPLVVEGSAVDELVRRQVRSDDGDSDNVDGGALHCILADELSSSATTSAGNQDSLDKVISRTLPQWRGSSALREASDRVVRTIERGFEANKLQAALKISIEKGDKGAEERIRAELAKFNVGEFDAFLENEDGDKGKDGRRDSGENEGDDEDEVSPPEGPFFCD